MRTVFSNWIIVVSRIAVLDIVKQLNVTQAATQLCRKLQNASMGKERTPATLEMGTSNIQNKVNLGYGFHFTPSKSIYGLI